MSPGSCKIRQGYKILQVSIPYYTYEGDTLSFSFFSSIPVSKLEDLFVVYGAAIWWFGNFIVLYNGTSEIIALLDNKS